MLAVDLHHLTVIGAVAEARLNRVSVWLERTGGDLKGTSSRRRSNLRDEVFGVNAITAAQVPRNNQLGSMLDGNKRVGIADARIVCFVRPFVAFFFLNESP